MTREVRNVLPAPAVTILSVHCLSRGKQSAYMSLLTGDLKPQDKRRIVRLPVYKSFVVQQPATRVRGSGLGDLEVMISISYGGDPLEYL